MWKKAAMGIMSVAAALTLSACGGASAGNAAGSASAPAAAPEGKSIVVYYSATGNTKRAAETIAKESGSDLYAITPKVPYTEADLDYNNSSSRVSREHKDSSIRPEYTGDVENWNDYKVVYLGYPIWWGEAPAIVYTFTEHHNFDGKTVIPFATSYSSPLGDSGDNLARAAKTGTWLPGECFTGGGKTDDVLNWIHSIKK